MAVSLALLQGQLMIVRDAELFSESRIDFCGLFGDVLDHGAARAAFQQRAELRENFRAADGVDFDPAIAKIARKTVDLQPPGFILSEIAETDALHDSRNKKAARDLSSAHAIFNCNISTMSSSGGRHRIQRILRLFGLYVKLLAMRRVPGSSDFIQAAFGACGAS